MVVSTMTVMALGFTGASAALSINFYRKYQARLRIGGPFLQYARTADYNGLPLPLAFEYRSENGGGWNRVEADVDEIYHYGSDYFMRGYRLPDRTGHIFKCSRMAGLRIRSTGRSLNSVEELLGETVGKEVFSTVRA